MKFQMAHLATTYAAVNSLVTIGGEKALASINRYNRLFHTSSKASRGNRARVITTLLELLPRMTATPFFITHLSINLMSAPINSYNFRYYL